MTSFGALLRHHRLAAQLTQEELAERAAISARSVSDIERGISRAPQKATVHCLARALCLSGDDLGVFEATARASRHANHAAYSREEIDPLLALEGAAARAETGLRVSRPGVWRSRLRWRAYMVVGLVAVLSFPLALTSSRASQAGSPVASRFEPWGWTSASLRAWIGSQAPSAGPTQFDHPATVAVDRRGNVYVADALADSITKLAPDGHVLARFGAPGAGRGQFDFPTGLAIDQQGDIYVADTNNNRIQKLSPAGKWLAWWGMLAHISGPTGVAVDARDNVYIADGGSAQVVKLSSSGIVLGRWSPTVFIDPSALAAARDGTVYVADAGAGTIVRLAPDGKLLSVWHFPRFVPGQYTYPTGYPFAVAVDRSRAVYVTDPYRDRVLKLSPSGRVQTRWGGPGNGPGEFDVPLGIAVDREGHIYVGDRNNHRIQKFSPVGVPVPAWGAPPPPASRFAAARALTTDGSSNVYILQGLDPPRLQELSPQGVPIREVALQARHQGDFLSGLAVDDLGDMYVADSVHNRVDMFSPTGKLRTAWGTAGIGEGQFHDPTDVAVDRWGEVYVADSDNGRVQVFSRSGQPLRDWHTAGYPQGVAVDSRHRVYVADAVRRDVELHSSSGELLSVLGRGLRHGFNLKKPVAVASDGAGDVYVADTGNGDIVEVSARRRLAGSWGGRGAFLQVEDVVAAPDGNVYALDAGSGHILKLTRSTN